MGDGEVTRRTKRPNLLNMRTTFRIPTNDQFAFVEIEKDMELFPEQIREWYDEYRRVFHIGEGLDVKVFNDALDEYLKTAELKGGTEIYAKMNQQQQAVFQEIKKANKRIQRDLASEAVDYPN